MAIDEVGNSNAKPRVPEWYIQSRRLQPDGSEGPARDRGIFQQLAATASPGHGQRGPLRLTSGAAFSHLPIPAGMQGQDWFIRILTNKAEVTRRHDIQIEDSAMADLIDEASSEISATWRPWPVASKAIQFLPPIISICCAVVVGYFTYLVTSQKPPADMGALAVSILKSGDASPEMRDWAVQVLGIETDIGMPERLARK